jgi:hypothetical protein
MYCLPAWDADACPALASEPAASTAAAKSSAATPLDFMFTSSDGERERNRIGAAASTGETTRRASQVVTLSAASTPGIVPRFRLGQACNYLGTAKNLTA